MVNQRILDLFTPLVKKAIVGIINDTISERLGLAMVDNDEKEESSKTPSAPSASALPEGVVFIDEEKGIVTTQEEIDSYNIVKAILCPVVDVARIFYRDAQRYFAILLDDNNRKPICRMHFNAKTVKYIGLFDETGKETRYVIQSLNDIFNFSEQLRATVQRYE